MTATQHEAVLIDTDVFSFLMSGGSYAALYRPHVEGKLIAISFITVGELYFGAKRRAWGERKVADLKDRLRAVAIVPYDVDVCLAYAEIKAACEAKGTSVADNDLWIAACAIRHSIPLVSNNYKHFKVIPGLILKSESQAMREMQSQMEIVAETTEVQTPAAEPERPSGPAYDRKTKSQRKRGRL